MCVEAGQVPSTINVQEGSDYQNITIVVDLLLEMNSKEWSRGWKMHRNRFTSCYLSVSGGGEGEGFQKEILLLQF